VTLALVFLGGGIGAVLRYLTGVAALAAFGPAFPWGTLIVNVLGCFLMGVLAKTLPLGGPGDARVFLMTGILGGFTTFSAFALDSAQLFERENLAGLAGYLAGSVGLSLAAVALGLMIGHMLAR
jgi:fluoride exporter